MVSGTYPRFTIDGLDGLHVSDAINRFLDETVALLIAERSPVHREVFIRQIPPANHKSMGVVAFTAPPVLDLRTVDLETDREYVKKCFRTAYGSVESPDYSAGFDRNRKRLFHSFIVGSLFSRGLAVTAIAEAGPGRWVAMFTATGTSEKLAKKTLFNDVEARLGAGWGTSEVFSVIDRESLYPFLETLYKRVEVRPDTLGYLSFRAAVRGERTTIR